MNSTTSIVELVLLLLLAASIVALVCNRLKIPYTIALVFAGFAIDLFRPDIQAVLGSLGFASGSDFEILTPEVVFSLFLPGLLFESSLHIHIQSLRNDLPRIALLAVVGVIIATLATGYSLSWWIGIPLSTALLFGALISATDPISVVALFREMSISPRLTLLVEGESLLNDGTAVVLFQLLLAAAMGGAIGITAGVGHFFVTVAGGALLGAAIGYVGSLLIARVDESRIEVTLTTIVAYGSFLAAEHMHVSGVIATVAAGLVIAGYGIREGMSSRTRVALFGFWEYFAFVINSLVFLLIGISVHITDLVAAAGSIAIATAAVILGRLVTIYALSPIGNKISSPVPFAWNHVLFWGGLHGTVSMALALGLPAGVPGRAQILSMTFGVVAFSIIVQGLTMKPLVNLLGLIAGGRGDYDRLKAEQMAASAATAELHSLRDRSLVTRPVFEELDRKLAARKAKVESEIQIAQAGNPEYAAEERRIAEHHLAMAERSALLEAVSEGVFDEHAATDAIDRVYRTLDADEHQS